MARTCECHVDRNGVWYGYCPAMEDAGAELADDMKFVRETGLSLADVPEDWQGCINDERLSKLNALIRGQTLTDEEIDKLISLVLQSMRGRRCRATSDKDKP